ncbi:MAG: hypothetical protein A2719_01800 [Candidatus Ryanbacteria bacterium RIFCSPHIGHO2_01_FULL_45_22]|uniref:DUF4446 domain-containing protein n=2 Tax=Candidatus Ryaniibacteriota TaxID=1817914 RepID=A0A1G2FYE1_9BACT|nr:MAG: hypothetical protein A2719_01800 [Candidatus Ryanbacteria bacterium RIFCSPHIGHO2_01_FULL_45_22]OGZ45357.1 MAG: hypothetical protein A3J54_03890 [Candidatus Ryanbacteria bacterium RIFCSPHIGHO2_02_FULL_45_13b]
MDIPFETIIWGVFGVLSIGIIMLAWWLWRMEKKLRLFFSGKDAKSLEDVFMLLRKEMMEARRTMQDVDARIRETREQLQRSVQNVGIVRFNPFRDAGGDQSFCIALLDEGKNGIVISSLYSRDGVRVYGKPISAGKSTYQLSSEEEEVIKKAIKES